MDLRFHSFNSGSFFGTKLVPSGFVVALPSLKLTYIAPKKDGFPIGISFSRGPCSGDMYGYVSFREGNKVVCFLHKVALHFLMMVELKSDGREDNEDT